MTVAKLRIPSTVERSTIHSLKCLDTEDDLGKISAFVTLAKTPKKPVNIITMPNTIETGGPACPNK